MPGPLPHITRIKLSKEEGVIIGYHHSHRHSKGYLIAPLGKPIQTLSLFMTASNAMLKTTAHTHAPGIQCWLIGFAQHVVGVDI